MGGSIILVPLRFIYNLGNISIPTPLARLGFVTLPIAIALLAALNYSKDWLQAKSNPFFWDPHHIEEYDFIVVGAGSAGSVVANRLSLHHRVLLLEGGGDPSPFVSIPALATFLQRRISTDWQYRTTSQNNSCFAMEDHRPFCPRGKGLGGTSNLNFMVYQRGNPRDYDEMAEIIGDPQWRYENLLEFFKRSEDYHGNYKHHPEASFYHSQGGPLYVGKLNATYMAEEFLTAGAELGYPIRDHNGYQSPSFSRLDVTMKEGKRWSTYEAFLRPILKRRNLVIYRYARVTKIHLNHNGNHIPRAHGVTYIRHGIRKFARARREIIISAGAIDSPKLLMLSGIGPCAHLHQHGLPCLVNLPVGQNFQDHVTTLVGPFTVNARSLLIDRDITPNAVKAYLNGQGPMASLSGVSAAGFIATKYSRDPNWPDIGFHMSGSGVYQHLADDFTRILGTRPGILQNYFGPHVGKDGNFVLVTLVKPQGHGIVQLSNSDPYSKPLINPNYFNDPGSRDIKTMVEGVKFVVNMYENTETYKRVGARFPSNPFPGCEQFELKSDAYFECYIRHLTMTEYHLSGTCSMGRARGDPVAVVDTHLRVLGVQGLRVADTSVLRVIPNANLNIPAIMIGEKASDLILTEWGNKIHFEVVRANEVPL